MAHILVVEDEQELSEIAVANLKFAKYHADAAFNCKQALDLISTTNYDLILLDILLPDARGDELCENIRKACLCPIIFVSCLDDSETIINSFRKGGDDYMVKPIDFPKLFARIDTLLENGRKNLSISDKSMIVCRHFSINTTNHCLTVENEKVPLSKTEYELLIYFIQHPDTLLLYKDIYSVIWQNDDLGDFRTLIVHISNLRKKIDPYHIGIIVTVRGTGYIFSDV